MARSAIKYELVAGPAGAPAKVTINGKDVAVGATIADNIKGFTAASVEAGYPKADDAQKLKVDGFFSALGNACLLYTSRCV